MVFIKMKIILQFYCENTTDAQQKDRRQLYTDRSFSFLKNRQQLYSDHTSAF